MNDKIYKIGNDSIQYIHQDTIETLPLTFYEKTPSKPIQYGIVTLWLTGLIFTILIFKKP